MGGGAGDALQGVAQLVLHLGHGSQQAAGFVVAIDLDRACQVAFGDFFRRFERLGNRQGDAAGQQPGEQHRQRGGDYQQANHPVKGHVVLVFGLLIGGQGGLVVVVQQAVEHHVDLLGVVQQFCVEKGAQLIDLVGARQALHTRFNLLILGKQAHVFVVDRAFFAAVDQFFVNALGCADLLVAQFEGFEGLLLYVRLAVGQQAVRQHAQAQGQLGELIEGANARHAGQGNVLGGATDLAHLVQGEHA